MNTQKVEAFLRIVELGSFTKAAEELGYSQSGLSHMIVAFEGELGVKLLSRSRAGVSITPEGESLVPHFRKIADGRLGLEDALNEIRGLEFGTVRIGAFNSVARHWLPKLIAEFHMLHPNIEFDLLHGDYMEIESWVSTERTDLGFLQLPSSEPFKNIPLWKDTLFVILPKDHELANADSFPVKRLALEPFVVLEEGFNNEVSKLFRKYRITPDTKFRVRDDYALMALVEQGLGISVQPGLVLHRNPFDIVRIPLDIHTERVLGIIMKNRKDLSLAARIFLDHVKQAFESGWADDFSGCI